MAKEKEGNSIMSEAFTTKFHWTTESIAEDLKMPVATFRVWKLKMEKDGKLTKPAVGSHFCIQDPHSKNRLLYSDDYVERVREIRESSPHRRRDPRKVAMKHALMKVTVPIFDENIVDYVKRKFKDEFGLQEHLKEHVIEIAKPALHKIEELKRKHEKELKEAMLDL